MNDASENSLWYLFVEGDVNAFSRLFKSYYSQLHNYGLKISQSKSITEDCLQAFFVYLYENKQNLGVVKNVKAYLFVSFRRALLKELKNQRLFSSFNQQHENTQNFVFAVDELKIEQELTQLKSDALVKLMNSLSVREREAIYLKYYSNLKIPEIASIMDISNQSVSNTLQKAFIKLRNKSEYKALQEVLQNS